MPAFPEWQHLFTSSRACATRYGPGAVITVRAGLHYLRGNRAPYFSVTANVVTPESRRHGDIEAGGCLHDDVLHHWPDLAPVVALHLCADDGAPMPAGSEGNAWYFLAGYLGTEDRHTYATARAHFPRAAIDPARPWDTTEYRYPTPPECLDAFARYVRLPVEEARDVARWLETWRDDWRQARAWLVRWCDSQRPRWRKDAEHATALLDYLAARRALTIAKSDAYTAGDTVRAGELGADLARLVRPEAPARA